MTLEQLFNAVLFVIVIPFLRFGIGIDLGHRATQAQTASMGAKR